ncbi:MAG: hypothetical protein WC876_00270 [Candidatus Thermoplasmatota archaeon]|jgi:hypothetical protein
MRAWASFALILIVALAGCVGGDDGPSSSNPTESASSSSSASGAPPTTQGVIVDLLPDFAFESCRGLSVRSAQPLDQVQALLPEGFTAASAPVEPAGTAVLGLDLYACGNLTTPDASIPDTVFGVLYTHVLRPVDRLPAAPEADVHEYAFRVLARDDVLARLWPAAGYETRNGTADVTLDPVGEGLPFDPGLRLGNGSVGGQYFVLGSGSPAIPPAPSSGSFARYTVVANDESVLVWTGTYSFSNLLIGQGTFEVPDDDPFAGFESANNLPGLARLFETGSILDQDLRRFF